MTDTEAALLRAIAAAPDEDTPRLVYADYLDEQGDPARAARAEFIRAHIRLERLPSGAPEHGVTQEQVRHLLVEWDAVWQAGLPPGFTRLAYYRRGFPYRAALTASLADGTDDPRLQLIECLELFPDVAPRELTRVLGWPLFARVKELVIRGHRVLGWAGTRVLAEGRFPRLERLILARQGIGAPGLRALAESWGFPRLRELDVSYNEIPAEALEAFGASTLRKRLVRLESWNPPQ